MKNKIIIAVTLLLLSFAVFADDSKTTPPKPYPLKTCLVCDMQFEAGEKPLVFDYKGQEIQVCDKSEKSAFDKNPDKYMKKLAEAEAKMKK